MSIYNRSHYYPETDGILGYTQANWQSFIENIKLAATLTHVVIKEEEGNIALVAYNIYGNVDVWPYLCHMNDIVSPLSEIKAGMELKYSDIGDLNRELSILLQSSIDNSAENVAQLPRFS